MAGTSRFHDKLHRCNHHTLSTSGVPDSGYDPIASPSSPFRGDFVTTHNLSTAQGVISDTLITANSAIINGNLLVEGDTTQLNTIVNVASSMYVNGPIQLRNTDAVINDGVNNATYGPYTLSINFGLGVFINPRLTVDSSITTNTYYGTNVVASSGAFTNTTTNNNAVVMGRLGVGVESPQKPVHIIGDVLIYGNLSANGDSSFRNTLFTTTSSLSIVNTGTGAGLTVSQEGDQPIVAFYDHESTISLWADGGVDRPGWVGIKTSHPTTELTVNGSISASGNFYGTIPGYSNIQTLSSKWDSSHATLNTNSAYWVSTYSTVCASSAYWDNSSSTALTLATSSVLWNTNYNTVCASSAYWDGVYTLVRDNSASWQLSAAAAYSGFESSSAKWDATTAYVDYIRGIGVHSIDVAVELGNSRTGDGNTYIDLHSVSGIDFNARISRQSGVDGSLSVINTGVGNFDLWQQGIGAMNFGTSNTNRMTILSNGNIGIANTNPQYKLDVQGNVRCTEEVIVGPTSNSNQARLVAGQYGVIFRNDGANFYLLPTLSGDQYGAWSELRPFYFNLATGKATMVNGLDVFNGLTVDGTNIVSTLNGKANTSHTHAISDVTNLQTTLDGKANTSHTHAISDVTNLQTTLDGKANTSHTHAISDVTNLQTTLDGKLNATGGVTNGSLTLGRQDSVNEGGQLYFSRASDNQAEWAIDSLGSTNTRLRFFKDVGGERMTILDNGNIGIGTAAPTEKLHVAGNIIANNIAINNATIATYTTPLTASGEFIVININGVDRKLRLWD